MSSSVAVPLRRRVPRMAGQAVTRARLAVVPRRRTATPRVPFVTLVSLVLVGGVVGLLMFNTSMQQASFAERALSGQASTLTAREQSLQMDLDDLRDPQEVAERAQSLGMVPAGTPAFLNLADGSITGEATAATAADGLRIRARPARKPAVLSPAPIIRKEVLDTSSKNRGGNGGGGNDGSTKKRNGR